MATSSSRTTANGPGWSSMSSALGIRLVLRDPHEALADVVRAAPIQARKCVRRTVQSVGDADHRPQLALRQETGELPTDRGPPIDMVEHDEALEREAVRDRRPDVDQA